MEHEELAILKLVSLCREEHSLHHPGLGGRREVAACIAGRCRLRWATMSEREKAPFLHMVLGMGVKKPTVPGKKTLVSGGKLVKPPMVGKKMLVSSEDVKSKKKKKYQPRFSGFLVFSKEIRRTVLEEMRAAGGLEDNQKNKVIMKEVGRRWTLLPAQVKAQYSSQAESLKREAETLGVKVEAKDASREDTGIAGSYRRTAGKFSGYLIFCNESKRNVMLELKSAGKLEDNLDGWEKCDHPAVLRELGRRWGLLTSQVIILHLLNSLIIIQNLACTGCLGVTSFTGEGSVQCTGRYP